MRGASGFTVNVLEWPSTWVYRRGLDRTPVIPPGHELAPLQASSVSGRRGSEMYLVIDVRLEKHDLRID